MKKSQGRNTNFNSHAHVERDFSSFLLLLYKKIFQLTRSRGAWQVKALGIDDYIDFNSHAHVERDGDEITPATLRTNFNSHAHVERDA